MAIDSNVDVNVALDGSAVGTASFNIPMFLTKVGCDEFAIHGVTAGAGGAGGFVIDGDVHTCFTADDNIYIFDNTGNGGGIGKKYTVHSSSYGAPHTTVLVHETVVTAPIEGYVGVPIGEYKIASIVAGIAGAGSITIAGDATYLLAHFLDGQKFAIYGSTENDGVYTCRGNATHLAGVITINVEEAVETAGVALGRTSIGFDGYRYAEFNRSGQLSDYDVMSDRLAALVAVGFQQSQHPDKIAVGIWREGDASVKSALDAVVAESNDWYAFCINSRTATDILAAASPDSTSASTWAESNDKLFFCQQSVADIEDTDYDSSATWADTDMASVLKNLTRDHNVHCFHADDDEPFDWGWLCFGIAADPDEKSTNWAYKPVSGVTKGTFTATQQGYLENKNSNFITDFKGNSATWRGKVSDGHYIDVIIAADWFKARAAEAIAQVLVDNAAQNLKVPYDDVGFEVFRGALDSIIKWGERVGHFVKDSGEIVIPKFADIPAADKADRLLRITGGAQPLGAVEKVTFDFVLSLNYVPVR